MATEARFQVHLPYIVATHPKVRTTIKLNQTFPFKFFKDELPFIQTPINGG